MKTAAASSSSSSPRRRWWGFPLRDRTTTTASVWVALLLLLFLRRREFRYYNYHNYGAPRSDPDPLPPPDAMIDPTVLRPKTGGGGEMDAVVAATTASDRIAERRPANGADAAVTAAEFEDDDGDTSESKTAMIATASTTAPTGTATASTTAGTTTTTTTSTTSVATMTTSSVGDNSSGGSVKPTAKASTTTRRNGRRFRLIQVMNTYAVSSTNTTTSNDNDTDAEAEAVETGRIHQPYDQWSTLQSIRRAKRHAPPEIDVTVVCAVFPSDARILSKELEPICDRFFELTRSTVTEYGGRKGGPTTTTTTNGTAESTRERNEEERLVSESFSKRELPMLQDLLDAAVSVAEEGKRRSSRDGETEPERDAQSVQRGADDDDDDDDEGFFVMVTNSDIGLTRNFYGFLLNELRKGRKALTINRWSIPMGDGAFSGREALKIQRLEKLGRKSKVEEMMRRKEIEGRNHPITIRETTTDPSRAEQLLKEIDTALPMGKPHPGYDCFVIHSSVVPSVRLGEMFAGFPPWGVVLQAILSETLSSSSSAADDDDGGGGYYARIESNPNATFHLGDQGTWSNRKKTDAESARLMKILKGRHATDLASCPRRFSTGIPDPHVIRNTANCGIQLREEYFRKGLLPELRKRTEEDHDTAPPLRKEGTARRSRRKASKKQRKRRRDDDDRR